MLKLVFTNRVRAQNRQTYVIVIARFLCVLGHVNIWAKARGNRISQASNLDGGWHNNLMRAEKKGVKKVD